MKKSLLLGLEGAPFLQALSVMVRPKPTIGKAANAKYPGRVALLIFATLRWGHSSRAGVDNGARRNASSLPGVLESPGIEARLRGKEIAISAL